MDKVDKAVIDLGGALPKHHFRNRKEGEYYVDGRAIKQVRGLTTKYICDIDEFMEARKRLENKPTEWPESAKILVFSPSRGRWIFGTFENAIPGDYEDCWTGFLPGYWMDGTKERGRCFGDWRQSLEPRPQPDNKEGEGVGWDEEGSFPPGGTTCEAFVEADAKNQYGQAGKWVSGISRGKALASNGGWGGIFEDDDGLMHFVGAQTYFRPIQSHRDKVIEAALSIDDVRHAARGADLVVKALAKHNLLKLPEGEE